MPLSQIVTGSLANNITITTTGNVSANIVSVGASAVSPVQSFRNKIINGNFDYWQRQTSNTNVVSGQYVADRWINVKTGTPTLNISQQLFTTGQTAVPNEPTYFYRANTVSSTGTANSMYVSQRVESARTLAGQTATLSFYAKADASKNVAVEFVQNFGTNGSAEANGVNVTTFSLTSSWQQFKTTVTLPSISGKTVDSANANYLAVNFWLDAGSTFNTRTNSLGQQSGNFDFSQVQLEAGSVATPFEIRPISTELALCQRYYQKWACAWQGISGGVGYQYSSSTGFSTTMRATPTAGVTAQTNSARFPSSAYSSNNIYPYGISAYYTAQSSGGNDLWYVDGTASAEL